MEQYILHIATAHNYLVYFFIAFISFAEGPTIALLCGFLLSLKYLNFFPLYFALMAGDLVGDTIWYSIGHKWGERFVIRFGKYVGVFEKDIEAVKNIFHKHKYPILLISKVTNGFGFALATLITAGMSRIPFPLFISLNFVGQLVWTGMLISAGYFFGQSYAAVSSTIERVFLVVLASLIILGIIRARKFIKKKFENK